MPHFSGVRATRSLVLCVCFVNRCLSFFFCPLRCLSFFDLRILITPLISSNSSDKRWYIWLRMLSLEGRAAAIYKNTVTNNVAWSLVLCLIFYWSLLQLLLLLFFFFIISVIIVLSILLRFIASDYSFGIFKFVFPSFLFRIMLIRKLLPLYMQLL